MKDIEKTLRARSGWIGQSRRVGRRRGVLGRPGLYRAKTRNAVYSWVLRSAQAARRYSLITPPRTRRRSIGVSSGMVMGGCGWVGVARGPGAGDDR
jgi:hypothetical protein